MNTEKIIAIFFIIFALGGALFFSHGISKLGKKEDQPNIFTALCLSSLFIIFAIFLYKFF